MERLTEFALTDIAGHRLTHRDVEDAAPVLLVLLRGLV